MFKREKPNYKTLLVYQRGVETPIVVQVASYTAKRAGGRWTEFSWVPAPDAKVSPVGINLSDIVAITEATNAHPDTLFALLSH